MNELQIFNYNNNEIRTVIKDGEAWFVAKDVCDVLGLVNSRKAVSELYDNEKMTVTNSYGHSGQRGGAQFLNVINEPGLYKLIFKSRKKEAKDFQDFVFYEVLPDIRKHGMFISDKLIEQAKVDKKEFDTVVNKYLAEKEKVRALEAQIEEEAAYVTLGKVVLALPGSVTVADAAQFLAQHGVDMGRNRLYKWGRDKKLLYASGKRKNKPTQKGIDSGIVNLELDQDGGYKLSTRTMLTAEGLKNLFNALFSATYPLFPEAEEAM